MASEIVCPLCVQYRCAVNHGPCDLDDMMCCIEHDYEPVWADGTVAEITQDQYCATCQKSLEQLEVEHAWESDAR